MIDHVLNPNNLVRALHEVRKNGGASGTDRMETDELNTYWNSNRECIVTEIQKGKYQPQAILGVESSEARS